MKKFLALVLALALVLSLAACGSDKEPAGDKDETTSGKVKLTVYTCFPTAEPQGALVDKQIAAFEEANQDIEVEHVADAHEAWATKLKTMIVGNNLPEVFISQPSDLSVYAESGAYMDLTDMVEADPEWKDSFVAGTLNTMQYDNRIYGIPTSCYIEGVFYNQAIFDQCGLTFPATYEELLNCIKVFKENNIVPFLVGGKDLWPVSMYTQFFMDRQAGYDVFSQSCSDEGISINTPEVVKGLTKFQEVIEMGGFSESALTSGEADIETLFLQGKAAMMVNGSWFAGQLSNPEYAEFAENVHFANFPGFEDGEGIQNAGCYGTGKSYCISSRCDEAQTEAALRLIKFLCSTEAADQHMEEIGQLTANKTSDDLDTSKVQRCLIEGMAFSSESDLTWPAYGELITPGYYDEMNKLGQRLLGGEITAQEMADALERARLDFQINN